MRSGNGPPALPTVTGQLNLSVAGSGATDAELAGASLVPAPIAATEDVALRLSFDQPASSLVVPYQAEISALLTFDEQGQVGSADVILTAGLVSVDSGGGPFVGFALSSFDVGLGTGTTHALLPVGGAQLAHISAGGDFDIAVRVDRTAGMVSAVFEAAGESLVSGAHPIALGTMQTVGAFPQIQIRNDVPGAGPAGEDDSLSVEVTEVELFVGPGISIPALPFSWLGVLGLAGVGVAWRRRLAR